MDLPLCPLSKSYSPGNPQGCGHQQDPTTRKHAGSQATLIPDLAPTVSAPRHQATHSFEKGPREQCQRNSDVCPPHHPPSPRLLTLPPWLINFDTVYPPAYHPQSVFPVKETWEGPVSEETLGHTRVDVRAENN